MSVLKQRLFRAQIPTARNQIIKNIFFGKITAFVKKPPTITIQSYQQASVLGVPITTLVCTKWSATSIGSDIPGTYSASCCARRPKTAGAGAQHETVHNALLQCFRQSFHIKISKFQKIRNFRKKLNFSKFRKIDIFEISPLSVLREY